MCQIIRVWHLYKRLKIIRLSPVEFAVNEYEHEIEEINLAQLCHLFVMELKQNEIVRT